MVISMLKIRRPLGRLIFNIGIAIPGKTVFLIETAPWTLGIGHCMWYKEFRNPNDRHFHLFHNSNNVNRMLNELKYFHGRGTLYTITLNISFLQSSSEISRAGGVTKVFLHN